MSDPLSIAAGVVGILTAAAQISTILIQFTKASRNAPIQARHIITEVSDTSVILSQLQSFLLGNEYTERSRTSLLEVDQVVTIVSSCVKTFSELEKILNGLKTSEMSVLDHLKWARQQTDILATVQRLQYHKASLSLILGILHGNTLREAKQSVDRLHDIVNRYYQEMSARLHTLESRDLQRMSCANLDKEARECLLDTSIEGILSPGSDGSVVPALKYSDEALEADFLDVLKGSRVYSRNAAFRLSTSSSDRHSTTWSSLSRLTVSEVSNISVFSLVITVKEVNNPNRLSQTWSNDTTLPLWLSVPSKSESISASVPIELLLEKSLPALPEDNDETSSTETVKEPTEGTGTSMDMETDKLSTHNGSADLDSQITPISYHDPSVAEEQDEPAYPCKACGEIFEEGKAFELAGHRWHIDCFRCNTCGTHLDSDTNLLLLGDGSPICNGCTYNCSACDKKIEDLAILTGDQAFCSPCFRCRNCKKKIENLKYARTSQGIFCMVCHESLMQRRRKHDAKKTAREKAAARRNMSEDKE